MKKLVVAALILISGQQVFAQGTPNASQRATEFTRMLAPQIGLDDARQLQVRKLTLTRMEKEQEVDRMYTGDEAMRQPKLQAIAAEYRESLKGVLTAGQFQRYEQWAATVPANATAAKP